MLAALMAVSSFTGCQKAQNNTTSENTAGTSVVEVEDAKSAVVMTIETYDVTQQDIYLYALQYFFNNGTVAAAVNDDNLDTLVNALMDEIKLEVVQQEIAKVTDGIELSDDEVQSYKDTANSFINFFGEDFLNKYGIDRAAVETLFEREALVNKLKDKAIADAEADYLEQYNKQFKDTDFFSAYYVLFPSIKYENGEAVKDNDGNYVSLSSDEMEEIKKQSLFFPKTFFVSNLKELKEMKKRIRCIKKDFNIFSNIYTGRPIEHSLLLENEKKLSILSKLNSKKLQNNLNYSFRRKTIPEPKINYKKVKKKNINSADLNKGNKSMTPLPNKKIKYIKLGSYKKDIFAKTSRVNFRNSFFKDEFMNEAKNNIKPIFDNKLLKIKLLNQDKIKNLLKRNKSQINNNSTKYTLKKILKKKKKKY